MLFSMRNDQAPLWLFALCIQHCQNPRLRGFAMPQRRLGLRGGELQIPHPVRARRQFWLPAPNLLELFKRCGVIPVSCRVWPGGYGGAATGDGDGVRAAGLPGGVDFCPEKLYGLGTSPFTPACAGNTQRLIAGFARASVHPRVSGEYSTPDCWVRKSFRSPPRERGILSGRNQGDVPFTPACARNTMCALFRFAISTVHPHLRGEYALPPFMMVLACRSPPLTRGIPTLALYAAWYFPFTPA